MDLDWGPARSEVTRLDLIAAAGVGIMSIDATGQILSANIAATKILRCHEADLIGRGSHEALNADRPDDDCELEQSARTGKPVHIDEDTFRRTDGSLVPVWWATTPLRDPETGSVAGAVLVFGDTTVRRAQAVADAAEREQGRAELAQARQDVADLEWMGELAQTLSSTLDEREVLERLARLVVGRLADIAVTDMITERSVVERVGRAVASGVDIDLDALLSRSDISAPFDPDSATYRTVTSAAAVHIPAERFGDVDALSEQSRSMLAAVGATDALAVPMVARGRAVGALGLIRVAGSPPFDDIDKLVATDIGHRAAVAIDNARLYRAQSDISTRLQRALLPAVPKNLLVRAAVRYLPARNRFDVGGDWYDLFRTHADADSTVLVIGDVAGHDLQAGTTMSALRNLLRGIVVATDAPPQHVLESVDANMDTLGIRGTATALLMTVAPLPDGAWCLAWSNAGHMPPLLLSPDGGVEMLNALHGTLLGTEITQVRTQDERVVPAGSTLVLYTDGLVETRDATIDAGLTHLRRTAMSLAASIDDPAAVAVELLARNHASSEDDTAMLVCHLPDLRS
ncbi:MAG TPA: SpoIIE family protein phosphatase [Jatrophihabitantaceae bacterium]|nr:SpoIIE family protein phosphatase [Jatrophihabitantaceae bacterium]